MSQNGRENLYSKEFRSIERRALRLSSKELVRSSHLEGCDGFPLMIQPEVDDLSLAGWAKSNSEFIESQLLTYGAILFRNFNLDSAQDFERFARAISPELLDYRERAAPRREVAGKIYTSTEYPDDQYIPLHHEMSYSHNWPTKISFFCLQPAQQGGRTPIAGDRKVLGLIDAKIKRRFLKKQVMYIRNYGEGVDLTWQEAFQTDDRSAVEEYCRRTSMSFEWRPGDRLRTRQIRQAVVAHPKTGETVWFNHSHMFHVSNLTQSVRESLLEQFREDELPRNAFYGDGSRIEDSVLEEIRETYNRAAVSFPWQKADVLMLDNFLASHGREPFIGPRTILVAMGELFTNPDIVPQLTPQIVKT